MPATAEIPRISRRRRGGAFCVVALIAVAALVSRRLLRQIEHANLGGRIEACTAAQVEQYPDQCAEIERAPKVFLVGPYDGSGSGAGLGRRQISADENRSFSLRVREGKYAIWLDLQGVLYQPIGLDRGFQIGTSGTNLTIRPGELLPIVSGRMPRVVRPW